MLPLPPRTSRRKVNLLLGCTGSIASIKVPSLVNALINTSNDMFNIILLPSTTALRFFNATDHLLAKHLQSGSLQIITDEDEWLVWHDRTDPVLHIELRKWADLLVIAPLSANMLANISQGLCKSLLGEVVRAWDYETKPEKAILVCPAMNTYMWTNPITAVQIGILQDLLNIKILGPVSKKLACGDTGVGGMSEVEEIVNSILVLANLIVVYHSKSIESDSGAVSSNLEVDLEVSGEMKQAEASKEEIAEEYLDMRIDSELAQLSINREQAERRKLTPSSASVQAVITAASLLPSADNDSGTKTKKPVVGTLKPTVAKSQEEFDFRKSVEQELDEDNEFAIDDVCDAELQVLKTKRHGSWDIRDQSEFKPFIEALNDTGVMDTDYDRNMLEQLDEV